MEVVNTEQQKHFMILRLAVDEALKNAVIVT